MSDEIQQFQNLNERKNVIQVKLDELKKKREKILKELDVEDLTLVEAKKEYKRLVKERDALAGMLETQLTELEEKLEGYDED